MGIPGYNEGPFKYFHVNTNSGTTTLKTNPGLLHSIAINAPGSAWTITVADGANNIAVLTPSAGQDSMIYDVGFNTSLVVTLGGTTAGDATICWI